MHSIVMPFLMSMLLGRSIDLTTYDVGGDVYDHVDYDETPINEFHSSYIVLTGNTLPFNYAGIPVDIAFKIKAGLLSSFSGTMGLDGVLKYTAWKERSAVVAVVSSVQTVERTLKSDAQPIANFSSRIPDSQTHYASSIIYGGWTVILYRYKCEMPGDEDIARETLLSVLGHHGQLNPKTIDLWEKAADAINSNPRIRGKVSVQVKMYSTFPSQNNFATPRDLLKTVAEFPNLVGSVGKPMVMKLLPLHDLNEKYPVVKENHVSDRILENLISMYDDLKNTRSNILRWISKADLVLTEEQENEIAALLNNIRTCIGFFDNVADEASVYKDIDPDHLNVAMNLYYRGVKNYTNIYDTVFRRLKEDFDTECKNDFYQKIDGLLDVNEKEKIELGSVEGGLEECKARCVATRNCKSIGYIDKLTRVKVTGSNPKVTKGEVERRLCIVYFRSSVTANVIPPEGANVFGVYDRKCQ